MSPYLYDLMCRAERIAMRNEARKPTPDEKLNARLDQAAILSGLIFLAVVVLHG